jgi:hypothetical protein
MGTHGCAVSPWSPCPGPQRRQDPSRAPTRAVRAPVMPEPSVARRLHGSGLRATAWAAPLRPTTVLHTVNNKRRPAPRGPHPAAPRCLRRRWTWGARGVLTRQARRWGPLGGTRRRRAGGGRPASPTRAQWWRLSGAGVQTRGRLATASRSRCAPAGPAAHPAERAHTWDVAAPAAEGPTPDTRLCPIKPHA